MFRFKISSDAIQFGILIAALLGIMGGWFEWAEAKFAKADNTAVKVENVIRTQIDGRAERISFENKLMDKLVSIDERLARLEGRLK